MRILIQHRWRELLGGGVIAVAVLVVFRGILPNRFLLSWDDQMAFENPHLQALTWERDRQGSISDLAAITPQQVQDVARIYF